MRRAPLSGLDLGLYAKAVALLARNPSIIVIPLLMAVIGVLVGRILTPYGGSGLGGVTSGLGGLLVLLLEIFGVGAACVIADDAWRYGNASFDRGWGEARRRGGEILTAAIGISLLLAVAQYASMLRGSTISLILSALIGVFLIWSVPAAAIGGIPGGAAIQVSIDRVRANPLPAAIATIVTIVISFILAPLGAEAIGNALFPYVAGTPIVVSLIGALIQGVALGYVALILAKTYGDAAFTRRW